MSETETRAPAADVCGDGGEMFARARRLIAERLGVAEGNVLPTSRFMEDLGADSLDLVELALAFEEEFSVSIPDRELEHFQTVASALGQLERLRSQGQA